MTPSRELLTRVLEEMPNVRLAVLFGSSARRTEGVDSDIDIGVSIEGDAACAPALNVALERATGRRVELILLDVAPPLLRFEIARSGLVLVERDRDGWAEFRAHAMIDWWDWAPTARVMHEAMMARLKEEAGRGSA